MLPSIMLHRMHGSRVLFANWSHPWQRLHRLRAVAVTQHTQKKLILQQLMELSALIERFVNTHLVILDVTCDSK